MNSHLSKRLLINLAVVAAAVGANAYIAYAQICGQRDVDARTIRSTSIRQNLDAYRAHLDDGLALLGRYEAAGAAAPAGAAAAQAASMAQLEHTLRGQLAGEAPLLASLGALTDDGSRLQQEIAAALERTGSAAPHDSRAWAAAAYTRLGMETARFESRVAALRQQEDRELEDTLARSTRASRQAMLLLVVTMLAGGALLIFTFRARENNARERIRLARAVAAQRRADSRTVRRSSGADVHRRSRIAALSGGQRGGQSSNTATAKANSST